MTFLKPLNLLHFYLLAVAEHKNLNDLINFINAELKKLAVPYQHPSMATFPLFSSSFKPLAPPVIYIQTSTAKIKLHYPAPFQSANVNKAK
jgi:hypothetical protein